jgi:HK97 family phage major capsid protein
VWLVSRRCVEQLFGMVLGSNTLVTYLPDLTGTPVMRLLGIPVMVTDLLPTLGSTGDIALVNPEFYAMAIRTQLTVESSIHVAFINDVTTFRFFARGGGIPIPDGTYAYKSNGSSSGKIDEHSPFVVLNA